VTTTATTITLDDTRRMLAAIAAAVEERASALSDLDAALGDGDHGVSLTIGFRATMAELGAARGEAPDIGALLNSVGLSLVNSVGAAMGPLYGTAFTRAGKVAAGKTDINGPTLAAMIEAARDGVIARGKASTGDKTMLDAFAPAARAARAAADDGGDVLVVLRAASDAAAHGAIATRDMIAKKGRASRLGERTRGHQDAGASSTALMLRAALLTLDPQGDGKTADIPR